MDSRRLPKRIIMGTLEKPDRCGRRGKEKERTDCMEEDLRLFGIGHGKGWKTVALGWEMVMDRGRAFLAAWRKDEE